MKRISILLLSLFLASAISSCSRNVCPTFSHPATVVSESEKHAEVGQKPDAKVIHMHQ